jgi:hypothetical protein
MNLQVLYSNFKLANDPLIRVIALNVRTVHESAISEYGIFHKYLKTHGLSRHRDSQIQIFRIICGIITNLNYHAERTLISL